MLFKHTQIAVKTKTFTILVFNETVIVPKIVILKPRILYDLHRQPSKIRNLEKKQLILPRMKSSRKF